MRCQDLFLILLTLMYESVVDIKVIRYVALFSCSDYGMLTNPAGYGVALSVYEVKEEGLVVRVTTADGEYGKDSNGVFTN